MIQARCRSKRQLHTSQKNDRHVYSISGENITKRLQRLKYPNGKKEADLESSGAEEKL
jgi:hypothetical protein